MLTEALRSLSDDLRCSYRRDRFARADNSPSDRQALRAIPGLHTSLRRRVNRDNDPVAQVRWIEHTLQARVSSDRGARWKLVRPGDLSLRWTAPGLTASGSHRVRASAPHE